MRNYFSNLGNVTYRLLIVLLLYTLSRFFFFFVNYNQFSVIGIWELVKIFIVGIRFDATAVIEINIVFILFYLLPFSFTSHKNYQITLNIFFFTVNGLILLLNYTDSEYFKFTAKRSTADLFRYLLLSNDTLVLIPQFLKDFWYVPLGWIVTIIAGFYLLKYKPFKTETFRFKLKTYILSSILTIIYIGFLFLIARGTGLKPVRIISAARYTQSQNFPLLLNTPFCIIHTLQEKPDKFKTYFTEAELPEIYNPEQQFKQVKPVQKNVVVIILESFSREFVGSLTGEKTYTPCLDSIISQALVFDHAFANGKKSIDALPAIFAGMMPISDEPYISSHYSSNVLEAMPTVLAKKGYYTSFFHGGRNGTMGFDDFSRIAGFKDYFGLNEYKGPEAFDGNWGIYDEEFLNYFAQRLNTFKQPFLSAVFTLSSHHPYSVPARYANKFPRDESKLLQSTRYTDFALGEFFKKVSKESWYKNTLFILTADHTARKEKYENEKSVKEFSIPIVFFNPGDTSFHGKNHRIFQQTDIMPSVFEYLGITDAFVAFGQSFHSTEIPWAQYFLSGIFTFIQQNKVITFDGDNILTINRLDSTEKDLCDTFCVSQMENKLKAIIQQTQTRLTNNTFFVQKKLK